MPGQALTAGFFGKIPATGDFVSRGLDPRAGRCLDTIAARVLQPTLARRPDDAPALRFLLGRFPGPCAGLAWASRDRVGRRFPLVVAAPVPGAGLPDRAELDEWLDRLEAAVASALQDGAGPDELWRRIAAAGTPPAGGDGAADRPVAQVWTGGSDDPVAAEAIGAVIAGLDARVAGAR